MRTSKPSGRLGSGWSQDPRRAQRPGGTTSVGKRKSRSPAVGWRLVAHRPGIRSSGTSSMRVPWDSEHAMALEVQTPTQPVLRRRESNLEPDTAWSTRTATSSDRTERGDSEGRPEPRVSALDGFGQCGAERPSDLEQQQEPKPKEGSGRPELRRWKPATDSNAEQSLEVEGDDGNLRARHCKAEVGAKASEEAEQRPGGQGEGIDRKTRRNGLEDARKRRSRPLGKTRGSGKTTERRSKGHGCERGKTFEG